MKKIINFTDQALKMIDFIQKRSGHRTFSATVHAIISDYYDDKFYTKWKGNSVKGDPVKPVEHMTPSQICEALGGKVVKNPMGDICEGVKGLDGYLINAPLSLMGQKTERGDYRVKN